MQQDKISNIRALAIMAVVLGHSIILYSTEWDIYETTRQCAFLDSAKAVINLFQMQIFFLLSGYLFYGTLAKNNSYKIFFKNKFQRLIIPYFLFGLLWMIPIKTLLGCPGYNIRCISDVLRIVGNLFSGQNNGHLWFLYSLFSIFVIEFLLAIVIKGNKLMTAAMLCIVLVLSQVSFNISYFNLPLTMMYLPWFHLGYLLALTKNYRWQVALTVIFVAISLLYHNTSLLYSLVIVLGTYHVIPNRQFHILEFISKHSFGIYLLHSPLIYITFTYMAESNPMILVLINIFVFGTIALALSVILKKQEYVRI